MYKGKINLGSIAKMRISFNLIMQNDDEVAIKSAYKKDGIQKLISKFQMYGNDYLRINPDPYISLDISKAGDKGDSWNSGNTVNLNRMGLFILKQELQKIITSMYKEKDLYFIMNGKLTLNNDLARNLAKNIRFPNNNAMRVEYAVISDSDNPDITYEGVVFHLNKTGNFVQLTHRELEFFYHEVSRYDLLQMSFFLILTDLLTQDKDSTCIENKVEEVVEKEIDTKPLPEIKEANALPDL